MKNSFSTEEVLSYLDQFPGTMYELSMASGLTQGALLKIKRRKSRPNPNTRQTLAEVLRLKEYCMLADEDLRTGHDARSYREFIAGAGLKRITPDTRHIVRGYNESRSDEGVGTLFSEPNASMNRDVVFEKDARPEEGPDIYESTREEIDAMHALILAQRKTIEIQARELALLRSMLRDVRK